MSYIQAAATEGGCGGKTLSVTLMRKDGGIEGGEEGAESGVVQELLVTQSPPLPSLVSLLFLPCPVSRPPAGMSGG